MERSLTLTSRDMPTEMPNSAVVLVTLPLLWMMLTRPARASNNSAFPSRRSLLMARWSTLPSSWIQMGKPWNLSRENLLISPAIGLRLSPTLYASESFREITNSNCRWSYVKWSLSRLIGEQQLSWIGFESFVALWMVILKICALPTCIFRTHT